MVGSMAVAESTDSDAVESTVGWLWRLIGNSISTVAILKKRCECIAHPTRRALKRRRRGDFLRQRGFREGTN